MFTIYSNHKPCRIPFIFGAPPSSYMGLHWLQSKINFYFAKINNCFWVQYNFKESAHPKVIFELMGGIGGNARTRSSSAPGKDATLRAPSLHYVRAYEVEVGREHSPHLLPPLSSSLAASGAGLAEVATPPSPTVSLKVKGTCHTPSLQYTLSPGQPPPSAHPLSSSGLLYILL